MSIPVMEEVSAGNWRIEFDGPEAKGVITLYAGGYGLSFDVNGRNMGLIDLFHLSPAHDDDGAKYPQLVVDNGDYGDAVAFCKLMPEGMRISFEFGVQELASGKVGERIYGYAEPED